MVGPSDVLGIHGYPLLYAPVREDAFGSAPSQPSLFRVCFEQDRSFCVNWSEHLFRFLSLVDSQIGVDVFVILDSLLSHNLSVLQVKVCLSFPEWDGLSQGGFRLSSLL